METKIRKLPLAEKAVTAPSLKMAAAGFYEPSSRTPEGLAPSFFPVLLSFSLTILR